MIHDYMNSFINLPVHAAQTCTRICTTYAYYVCDLNHKRSNQKQEGRGEKLKDKIEKFETLPAVDLASQIYLAHTEDITPISNHIHRHKPTDQFTDFFSWREIKI